MEIMLKIEIRFLYEPIKTHLTHNMAKLLKK